MTRLESIVIGATSGLTLRVGTATPNDRFQWRGADGLGPPPIGVFQKNGVLQGRVPDDRTLVFRIGLNPRYHLGETVEGLREEFYALLSNPSGATLIRFIYEGATKMVTTGYISNFEVAVNSKDPEIQVTFETNSPFFKAPTKQQITGLNKGAFTITNQGTAPSGVYMTYTFTKDQPATGFKITRPESPTSPPFHIIYPSIKLGDQLVFNTEPLERFIKLIRGSLTINLIDYLSADSEWIELARGQNKLQNSDLNFNWGIVQYQPKYWGV